VQGLADAFIMLFTVYIEAKLKTESRNFETLYLRCNRIYGNGKVEGPYSSFEGSPMSKGESNTICE
jgi:ribonucleoside-diphosphate reductase alpha chain